MTPKILVVDDDLASVKTTIEVLEREGYEIHSASGGRQALNTLGKEDINVVITDLRMPDLSGIDLLKYIQGSNPYTQVIILTGYGTIDSAVEAMREGAFYYLKKPIEINTLRQTVKNALEKQLLLHQNIVFTEQLEDKRGFENIVGNSKLMRDLFHKIRLVAPTMATVLITGESGVGKELIAKAIHNHSPRRDSSYKPINCGALHRELLESELFGHERGAFTGATARKRGVFEQADGGTLFLDEIGEMGLETQVKFLRVLEEQKFNTLGGDSPIMVDVRVIAATNKDLENAVKARTFRADLYYRISGFPMPVPPLRERREDIPLLVTAFIEEFSGTYNKPDTNVSPDAMEYLKNSYWPGNIRELRNAIESAVILATSRSIEVKDLAPKIQNRNLLPAPPSNEGFAKVGMTLDEIEKEAIIRTLKEIGGNEKRAAEMLGIDLRTLHGMLESFGLLEQREDYQDEGFVRVGMTMDEIEKEAISKTLTETGGNKKQAAEMLGIGVRTLYRKLESYSWQNKSDGDTDDSES